MDDGSMLVIGLYTYDDLLAHAAQTFKDFDLFASLNEPGYRLLWECISKTYETTGSKPTPYMLANQAVAMLGTLDLLARVTAERQMVGVLKLIRDKIHVLERDHAQVLLEAAAQTSAIDRLLSVNMLEDSSKAALMAEVGDVTTLLNSVTPKQGVRKRPLAPGARAGLLKVRPRWKWGIDYWDEAELSWYKKEIHGLLGPSGGGKTVNMTNIAARQIKEGRNVAVALYEQPLEEDVTQRIISNVSGVPMSELRDKDEKDIPAAVLARIDAACEDVHQHLLVLDMVGEDAGNGGVNELKAQLAEEKRETGFVPDLIIIDWLGEMVLRYEGNPGGDGAYRRTCEKFMSELVQYKNDNECCFLILHQTSTDAQAHSCTTKPKKTQAYEFRAFAFKCDSCSVLGTMDRILQVCWFIPDKSRRSCSRDRLVKLDGNYMKFNDVTTKYEAAGNLFIESSAAVEQDRQAENRREEAWG